METQRGGGGGPYVTPDLRGTKLQKTSNEKIRDRNKKIKLMLTTRRCDEAHACTAVVVSLGILP